MKKSTRIECAAAALLTLAFVSLALAAPGRLAPKIEEKKNPQGVVLAPVIGPSLQKKLAGLLPTDSAGVVIVAFNTVDGLHQSHIDLLNSILGPTALGLRLQNLGMVGTLATKAQIGQIAQSSLVRSIWANDPLNFHLHQARVLTGVDKLRADPNLRPANNDGRPYDGHAVKPNQYNDGINPPPTPPPIGTVSYISPLPVVVINDSGIDARHPDLYYTMPPLNYYQSKVIQNAMISSDPNTPYQVPLPTPPNSPNTPLTYSENIQNTDLNVAHGTHCSGIVGGTGHFALSTSDTVNNPANAPFIDYSGVASAGKFSSTVHNGHGWGDYAPDNNPPTSNPNLPAGANPAPVPQNAFGEASGVKLIGTGSGAGLLVLNALGGFEYCLIKQQTYNIRIVSNSFGGQGQYNPDDPINIATKQLHDAGVTIVFSAGNSGPGVNTIGPNSKSPYVICVAAGTKEGGLASFSSRGLPARQRNGDAVSQNGTHYNPEQYNLPTITAPGTGYGDGFNGVADLINSPPADPNSKKFTTDMVSTKTVGVANGQQDQYSIVPAYLDYYTAISGTSMACPFIAGTAALMLDANPTLTPDQIKDILQQTATHTPGLEDWETGVGYVNVYAAVDKAANMTKGFYPFNRIDSPYAQNNPPWNTQIVRTELDPPGRPIQDDNTTPYPPSTPIVNANHGEAFTMPYSPMYSTFGDYAQAKAQAKEFPNQNAYAFKVAPDPVSGKKVQILDVRIQFGGTAATLIAGNSLEIFVFAPDGTQYDTTLPAIPLLQTPAGQIVINNPIEGTWVVQAGGFFNTPTAVPDTVTGQIYRSNIFVPEPPDITEVPQKEAIETALANRYLDTVPGGSFLPTSPVTKEVFGQALADNTPLRQSLASPNPKFSDVSGSLGRAAEALSVPGSTLRDFDFTPLPTLGSGPTTFGPTSSVSRAQVAISLVRALGLDKQAQAIANKTVQVTYNGVTYDVVDANNSGELNAEMKGYIQMALNRGILTYFVQRPPGGPTKIYCNPSKPMIRADLAIALNAYRQIFRAGNTISAAELP